MMLKIVLSDDLKIYGDSKPHPSMFKFIHDNLTFWNPEYIAARKTSRWISPELQRNAKIFAWEMNNECVMLPRGFWQRLSVFLKRKKIKFKVKDLRVTNVSDTEFRYNIPVDLRDYQERAVEAAITAQSGIIQAPCGSGKTQILTEIARRLNQMTLILVHTDDLMQQMQRRMTRSFGMPIGTIKQNTVDIQPITVASVQTMDRIFKVWDEQTTSVTRKEDSFTSGQTTMRSLRENKVSSNVSQRWEEGEDTDLPQMLSRNKQLEKTSRGNNKKEHLHKDSDNSLRGNKTNGRAQDSNGTLSNNGGDSERSMRHMPETKHNTRNKSSSRNRSRSRDEANQGTSLQQLQRVDRNVEGRYRDIGSRDRLLEIGADEFLNLWGCVMLDESHHLPATSFANIVKRFPARYRFGTTATTKRTDNLEGLMYAVVGYRVFNVTYEELYAQGHLVPPIVRGIETTFEYRMGNQRQYGKLLDSLVHNEDRNRLILSNLLKEQESHNLILSGRIEQLEILHRMLLEAAPELGERAQLLIGRMSSREREEVLFGMMEGRVNYIFATQLADEGLDLPILDRLHLVFPARAETKIQQQVGRIQRPYNDKIGDPICYDYIDIRSPSLASQFQSRNGVYRDIKAKVMINGRKFLEPREVVFG